MAGTLRSFFPARPQFLLILITMALVAGCATQQNRERTAMLSLPYKDFDQTYGSGFRALYDRGQFLEAAGLIGDYLKAHPKLTPGQQKFLHFHAAQLYALAGRNKLAVEQMDQALYPEKAAELGADWNSKISATKAFLMQNRAALLTARGQCVGSNAPPYIDRLTENLGSSYADVLLWHRISPKIGIPQDASNAHRAAAKKLATAFDSSLVQLQTNPPNGCVWLELRSFHPFAYSGYVIIHCTGGTLITASDQPWLDAAVDRFIKSSRMRNGHREARYGLVTSFDVPTNPTALK